MTAPHELVKRPSRWRQIGGLGVALAAVALSLTSCGVGTDDPDTDWPEAASITPASGHSRYHFAKELGEETPVRFPGIGSGRLTLSVDSIEHVGRCVDRRGVSIEGAFIVATMHVRTEGLSAPDRQPLSPDNWSVTADRGRERHTIENPCAGNELLLNLAETGARNVTAHFTVPEIAETLRLNVGLSSGEIRGWEWAIPADPDRQFAFKGGSGRTTMQERAQSQILVDEDRIDGDCSGEFADGVSNGK